MVAYRYLRQAGETRNTPPLPSQIDVLHLRVAEDFIEAFLFADTALLPAAVRRADVAAVGIDPDIACLDPFRRFHRPGEIIGNDGRGEAVFDAVHLREHLFVIVPGHDRHDRAEYLFATDPHRRRDVVENRRRDE